MSPTILSGVDLFFSMFLYRREGDLGISSDLAHKREEAEKCFPISNIWCSYVIYFYFWCKLFKSVPTLRTPVMTVLLRHYRK